MFTDPAPFQSSSRRPVPLMGRLDLLVSPISFRGILHYVVKDPVGLKYHWLRAEQFRLLQLLDGRRDLESLRESLVREFPAVRPALRELQQLVADLHQKGLAYSARAGQAESRQRQFTKQRRQEWRQFLSNLLSWRLPGWDPDPTLRYLLPGVRWLFRPWAVGACVALIISSWISLALHWDEVQRNLPAFQQFFGWPNLLFLWLTLAGVKVLHEFGHGLACRYFGGECHAMGVMLLVFSPSLYCDVTDSWMLPSKWQRIVIAGAGMSVEVLLSAVAIFIWQSTSSGFLHYLSLNLFFVTAVTTVMFNANPLMRLDGYYMLSDWLEIPNLRPQADQFLRQTAAKLCLGIEPPHDAFAPQSGRGWFALFAVAAHLYGWFVLGGILLFLYAVLKPYGLQSLGQTVAGFSIGSLVGKAVMQSYRLWKAPRAQPINRLRLGATLALTGLLVAGLLQLRVPWYRTAACLIEPEDLRPVLTKVPGQIREIRVAPGEFVRAGDVLVQLQDPELELRRQELVAEIRVQTAELDLQTALGDLSTRAVVQETLRGLREQEAELLEHLKQLTIEAPTSGRIVAAARAAATTIEAQEQRLPRWESTPLDPRNLGAFLPERTEVLSIAPQRADDAPQKIEAVVYLHQSDRLDVRERQKIRLKFDYWPQETWTGHVRQISTAETDTPPTNLSNKQGGSLATVTDREGRETLEQAAYQLIVEFQDPPRVLTTGLRGQARFVVWERSLGAWLWRWVRQTFDFEL